MKITVLGCGALGQIWLTALQRQGHEVQGWLRVAQPYCSANVITPDGVTLNQTFIANDPLFLSESDLLLVTLKAWQVSTAVKNLEPLLSSGCAILLLHNGMGTLEELGALVQPLLNGITTHAARHDDTVVVHVAAGVTHIGPANAEGATLSDLAEVLHHALPDVAWHNHIASASWNKLAVNCVINPLSVEHNCQNGDLLVHREQIALLCDEIAEVMVREGEHTSSESLQDYAIAVMQSTAANTSSMLQDIRAQRRTEIEYITGYLLRRARAQGLTAPENRRLYELVKNKESWYERERIGLPRTWQ